MADQALDALGEHALLRIEVARQRAGDVALHRFAPAVEALGQRRHQALALLAHRVAVDHAARRAQREHADLQRGLDEVGARPAFGVLARGEQHFGIGKDEVEVQRLDGAGGRRREALCLDGLDGGDGLVHGYCCVASF
ncbi:hypothetical protein HK414_09085 [Ramlibacter terrae]|uniref:Uncharacterized protein n=1 Tax=Ramlibacter terrae TaxID=2732511 RepID=A0ABX6P1U2_9BURK|nr:hypothetical protein HK414_09085 [Ramlibacter terrae]